MKKKFSPFLRQIAETFAMTLIIFLFLVTFVVQGYKVYGSCMEPNLNQGERLLGNKFIYRFDKPSRGDIIVFRYPKDPSTFFIKRIIAMPGETVEISDGKVYVNGRHLNESYVIRVPHGDFPHKRIPDGYLFVMGDNRDESNDSRKWGLLPMSNIQAKAWFRYWPCDRLCKL